MKYRALGKTGIEISEVGLGTWQLGSSDWGHIDEDKAFGILKASVDAGVNFFDTADVYGNGVSEQTIGRFLKRLGSDKVYIATKLGRRGDDGNGWPQNFSLDAMRQHTQRSLANLGVDTIFLQQLHCIPTEALRAGEVFDHLRTLQREGLIQHWGVSVETCEEGVICMEHEDCTSLQVIFNIFRQMVTEHLLAPAAAKNVAILARVPLASGVLSGKFSADTAFDEKDHRHYNANGEAFNVGETFAGVPFKKAVEFAERIGDLTEPASEGGKISQAQLALRWVLDHQAVTSVIPGASRVEQAQANAAASNLSQLDATIHEELRSLYDRAIAPTIRGGW